MSIRKLNKSETEALLTELADNRSCANDCDCVFCHEFNLGVASGRKDARIEFRQALRRLMEELT